MKQNNNNRPPPNNPVKKWADDLNKHLYKEDMQMIKRHILKMFNITNYSVQFSRSVVSDFLRPCGLQHARPPCPSPTPWVYSNSCPLSQWCHPIISSSVIPFSSRFQSFPESGSTQMSQLFATGGQSIGVSASTSVLPNNIQDWFPLGWTGWISLTINKMKRQPTAWDKIFANDTTNKGLIFKIYKHLIQLNTKK